MNVDIIIPVRQINRYIHEAIPQLLNLDYKAYGIIILPDTFDGESFPKTKIIATGNMSPAKKRDLAIGYSSADIFAFIDDDAYPRRDWIKNAVRHFRDPDVGAVGGPAVTPPHDSFYQKLSGAVFLSKMGGGNPERYWPMGSVRQVDDWPSVNLFVRRDLFERIGGFNSAYWPGEDTKFCLDLIRAGKKIIYDPEVFVWHHRREGLIRHLKQIGRYGLHRGFFAKRFPATSRRLKYFLPSFFVMFIAAGICFIFLRSSFLVRFYSAGVGLYLLALGVAFFQIYKKERKFTISFVSLPYIVLTHLWYGLRFLQGFLWVRDLNSKLRGKSE